MNPNLEKAIETLNPQQRMAVEQLKGPVLILAGAGSGKTKVLTVRIATLLDKGIIPERILALTFTKKAANEMKSRIAGMVGDAARRLEMGTFHSVLASIIRPYMNRIGFGANFTIMDEDDSERCIKDCTQRILAKYRPPKEEWSEEQTKQYKTEDEKYKPKDVQSHISWMKNRLINAFIYNASELMTFEQWTQRGYEDGLYVQSQELLSKDRQSQHPRMGEIFAEYANTCRQNNVLDFDDILLYTYELMVSDQSVREDIACRFDYILVDEYQDTNTAQYRIISLLTQRNRNICVVGDDSQSIYAFRGAQIKNILNFKREYGANEFKLEQNYRSTQNIVNAANRLIANNSNRLFKVCFSRADKGSDIVSRTLATEKHEANYIADTIREKIAAEGMKPKDFAILYRTNAQSRELEQALIRKHIKYEIYSGTSFFDRAEVKDQLAYLKLAINPNDEISLRRIINRPTRGIGETTVNRLCEWARYYRKTLWELINSWEFMSLDIPKKAFESLEKFKELINCCILTAATETAYRAAYIIADNCGLLDELNSGDEKDKERADNIKELIGSVISYEKETAELNEGREPQQMLPCKLDGYLQNVMLITNAEKHDRNSADTVSMMTLHGSKGLEFNCVFITGMEENLFPKVKNKTREEEELEEERRLFYVGVTRAKKELYLTNVVKRFLTGKEMENKPSRFINELLEEETEDNCNEEDYPE